MLDQKTHINTKRALKGIAAACLCAALCVCTGLALADSYTVTDENSLRAAVQSIEAQTGGTHSITLAANVAVSSGEDISLRAANAVSLYGNGHTLTIQKGAVTLSGSADLRLFGSEGTLQIISGDATRCIVAMGGSAKLTINDGVTLGPSVGRGMAGGVQLNGSASLVMNGGVIEECSNTISVAGGVFLTEYSTFTMNNGVIRNCTGMLGGGVGVGGGTFTMRGGAIENCTGDWYGGGGVCVSDYYAPIGTTQYTQPRFVMEGGSITGCTGAGVGIGGGVMVMTFGSDGVARLNSGEITGNTAAAYGGGAAVYMGKLVVGDSMKVHNNSAAAAGDDLFSYGTVNGRAYSTAQIGKAPAGIALEGCGHAIDGWYEDAQQRWTKEPCVQGEEYTLRYTPAGGADAQQLGLKAAHGTVPAPPPATGDNMPLALMWCTALACLCALAAGARKVFARKY